MSIVMDFTTTAMARPDVIYKTYKSFSKNLVGIDLKECRLFINIDPLPIDVDRKEVTKIASQYFKEVNPNYPEKPNFTAACNWLWSNAETKYIFHLEDDWTLLKKVSVPLLLKYFNKQPELMQVILRAYRYTYFKCVLSPGIFHERFYKMVAGKLNEGCNPEIQLRGKKFGIKMPDPESKITSKGKIIVHESKSKNIIVKDSGRAWLKKSGYKKPKKKGSFTSWESKRR